MVKIPVLILYSLILSQALFGQELKTFKINPGQLVYDVITPKDRYAFNDFQTGLVYFKNNALGSARMNYNAILAEVEFIDEKGDTLSLDKPETIKYITIATDTFYYDN